MYKVNVEEHLNASIEHVFERLTNHEEYYRFPGIDKSLLVMKGMHEKNGIGAQRVIKSGWFTLHEIITDFQSPSKMEYRITKSFPLKIHHVFGQIILEKLGNKTKVCWRSEFEIKLPLIGKKLEQRLGKILTQSFSRILKHSEK